MLSVELFEKWRELMSNSIPINDVQNAKCCPCYMKWVYNTFTVIAFFYFYVFFTSWTLV